MGISALLASQILDASATGRSVITGADTSAIRTTLGLGTLATQSATITDYLTIASAASTYQPLDSDLTSIAALSTTAFGRGLLTEVSATTARSTLGLGTLATQSPTGTPSASTFLRGDYSWQTIDLSGYVPYSGATGAVNLGANALTASRATLATGTITASTPAINVTQTWNNAATTFTGILANVTDTASNAASLLMDLQTASTTRFRVWKDGSIQNANGSMALATSFSFNWVTGPEFRLTPAAQIIWATTSATSGGSDLVLVRDAVDTLAQRRSTNAQTFRLYNTYTDSSNYERAKIAWESNVLRIGTEKAGTGSARALELQTDGTTRLTIASTGAVTFSGNVSMPASSQLSWGAFTILQAFSGHTYLDSPTSGEIYLRPGGGTIRLTANATGVAITGQLSISAINLVTDTTTGTKIGTATTQKLGFFNATPVVQPTAVANATDAASVITQLNALLSRMRDLGLIAT